MRKPKQWGTWSEFRRAAYREMLRKQKQRERIAKKTGIRFPKGRRPMLEWNEVDWSINNSKLSKMLGITASAIRLQRIKRGERSPALTWEIKGFKSKQDWEKTVKRNWRKNNPPTPDEREKLRLKALMRIIPIWKKEGFDCKQAWVDYKEIIKANKPCSKCGGKRYKKNNGKYCCRACQNKSADEFNKRTGYFSIRSRAYRQKIPTSYIADCLGLSAATLKHHSDLLEAKREQIKILRELKPRTRKNKHNAQEPEQPATSPR